MTCTETSLSYCHVYRKVKFVTVKRLNSLHPTPNKLATDLAHRLPPEC